MCPRLTAWLIHERVRGGEYGSCTEVISQARLLPADRDADRGAEEDLDLGLRRADVEMYRAKRGKPAAQLDDPSAVATA